MIEERRQVYEFDEFRLDALKRQLTRGGEVVALYSKAFDLLLVLVQNGGRDLTKDELLELVWPGQILEESNLTVNMSAVRRALGEKAAQPRYIVTMPGRGYRFVADVHEGRAEPGGVIIESQTVSQITIREETDDSNEAIEVARRPASLSARASSAEYIVAGLKQHKLATVAVIVLAVGVAGLSFYLHRLWPRITPLSGLRKLSLNVTTIFRS